MTPNLNHRNMFFGEAASTRVALETQTSKVNLIDSQERKKLKERVQKQDWQICKSTSRTRKQKKVLEK